MKSTRRSRFAAGADRLFLSRSGSDQLLDGDRKAANANPSRVPDRVGDCAGRTSDSDFAHPLNAERVHMRVVITLTGLTEVQRRAYVIADNKLALNAGW